MKKIFTFFAALVCAVSMFAAQETVYFVNAQKWTGTINAYAWTSSSNASWPGLSATKEAEQIAGCDIYSYTAEAGTYANIIFNNGSMQTADLKWTAGKYYCKDGWYTKEEVAVKLGQPIEYESVYFVNVQGWSTVKIYTWTPNIGSYPGIDMKKETEKIGGKDVYSYTVEKGTSFGGMLFNCGGDECKTGDLQWTAGKYYVADGWYTKEEAETKLNGGTTDLVTYYVTGTFNGWANPDYAYAMVGEGNIYKKDLTLAAGAHMLKVTNGTWDDGCNWGYGNITGAYEEVSEGTNDKGEKNGNILITLAAEKTVTVVFDADSKKISFEGLTEAGPAILTYVLMGVAGDWNTGIALEQNPANEKEYMLICQTIAEGDAVKVVTVTDGEKTAYCGNVEEGSVSFTSDEHGNIVLSAGIYDFYYKLESDIIYIGKAACDTTSTPEVPENPDDSTTVNPDPVMGVTYDVVVPVGTYACYIAGEMNGWGNTEMTKVDDTHYTLTLDSATTAMKYKYCSGPSWDYVEMQADGVTDVVDRSYAAYDTVAVWKAVYDPNASVLPDEVSGVYTIAGAVGLVGAEWDPTATINDMVKQEDGTYVLIKENVELIANLRYEYKVVKDHVWNIWSIPGSDQGNQILMVDKSGVYDVKFTLDIKNSILTAEAQLKEEMVLIPLVQLAGNMTDWVNNAIDMQLSADSLTACTTIPLLADLMYQIKVIVGGNWKGYEGIINRENCTDILFDSEANCNLYADVAGDYTFTWTYATNTLSVGYPAITDNPDDSTTVNPDPVMGVTYDVVVPAGTYACYIAGEMNGWSHTEMTKVDDTHYTLTVDSATTAMKYKYCSGPGWAYVEKTAAGEEVADRTYSANDVVESWSSVYDPNATEEPTPEMGVTYNVTVPAGTYACYLAGEMNGWSHTEMTKVDDTHYTLTVDTATTAMKYKYCSGPGWDYVELQADGSDVQDRTYSENDEVAAWKKVYDPTSTPTPNPGDAKDITVKAKVPAEWTNGITVWVWPTGGAGSEATPTQEGEWYVYTQNCTELNIIFKNGTGWSGDANQTVDMTFTESTCIEITAGSGKATYVVVECDSNTATEDVVVRQVTQKLIYDGQVFLIRDGKMYNVLGQVIK